MNTKIKMDESMTCMLCGGSTTIKHKEFPGYQQPETFKIYHCMECDTAFASPRIDTSQLYETIYKNGKNVPGYERYWKYGENIKKSDDPLQYLSANEDIYWGVKESLSKLVNDRASTKILEIGSGLGYLTYALNKAKYNTTGIDISQTAVEQALDTFGNYSICADVFDYASDNSSTYDIIILTEVIEHVAKPIEFLEAIYKLLKPQGHVIVTTPNKSFYSNKLIWVSDLPPVHWWWFSEDSMKYIAKRTGMSINFIDFSKYYKLHYRAVNMDVMLNSPVPSPTFDMRGDLIIEKIKYGHSAILYIRSIASKILILKYIFRKFREITNSSLVVCGERGFVLCAVLKKS